MRLPEAHLQGARVLRNEAYDYYAGMTKGEGNAGDESLANSSRFEAGCLLDEGFRPLRRSKRMHVGIGGQDVFVNHAVAISINTHAPFHMKNQLIFVAGPIGHSGIMEFMASDLRADLEIGILPLNLKEGVSMPLGPFEKIKGQRQNSGHGIGFAFQYQRFLVQI